MAEHPPELHVPLALRSGEPALLRPLRSTDSGVLGRFFLGLSAETISLYGPHPFDQETADRLCAEADTDRAQIRLLLLVDAGREPQALAYFIVGFVMNDADVQRYAARGMPLDDATDATIAPVVADAHQNSGFGSLLMLHLMPWLRRLGKRRLVLLGGVRQHNARAIHFYEKWGFRPVGMFTTSAPNIDMIAEL